MIKLTEDELKEEIEDKNQKIIALSNQLEIAQSVIDELLLGGTEV